MRPLVVARTGQKVRFVVSQMNNTGEWALVAGGLVSVDGKVLRRAGALLWSMSEAHHEFTVLEGCRASSARVAGSGIVSR